MPEAKGAKVQKGRRAKATRSTDLRSLLTHTFRLIPLAMRNCTLALSMAAALIMSLLPGSTKAQVFIADTNARDILNDLIPGIVDGAGIMDTLHPGIPSLDSANIVLPVVNEAPTIVLDGLQYLSALDYLEIQDPLTSEVQILMIEALPMELGSLQGWLGFTSIGLPQLPRGFRELQLYRLTDAGPPVSIAGMPDSLNLIRMDSGAEALWPDTPYTDVLSMNMPNSNMSIGYLEAGQVVIDPALQPIDFLESITTRSLYIHSAFLAGGMEWPHDLEALRLIGCNFNGVPGSFPETLDTLILDQMQPECLPWLPDGISYAMIGQYQASDCLPNWPADLDHMSTDTFGDLYPEQINFCSVLNNNCPGSYPGISGHILMDVNGNGQCDTGEPPLPQSSVTIMPNGNVTGCDPNSYWEIGVLPGSYSIVPSSNYPYYQSISPAQHTADLPNMGDADTLNDFAVTLIPDMQDLRAHFFSVPPRPGFDNRLYLTCENYGTVPMDAELTLSFTADQTWAGSSVAPTSQTATTASWQLNGMAVGSSQQITVDLHTATIIPLGTPVEYTISALPNLGDQTPADNVIAYHDTVVGSFDPNDKLLSPRSMSPAQVQSGLTPIEYTIRFQNTGTAAAERVVIVDTLPEGLQPQRVEFLSSSHVCHWYVLDGVLHFIHEGINLPDSTSDGPGSHGYVQFRILPATDLTDGETVTNIAHIVFDFNEPIVTPPAIFRVDVLASVDEQAKTGVQVHPNPVRDRLWIALPRTDQAQVGYVVQDLLGQKLMTGRTSTEVPIDMSGLPCGVFVLTTNDNTGTFSTRFVKQ